MDNNINKIKNINIIKNFIILKKNMKRTFIKDDKIKLK